MTVVHNDYSSLAYFESAMRYYICSLGRPLGILSGAVLDLQYYCLRLVVSWLGR